MAERRVELNPGEVWWAAPDASVGREQAGRRPVVIVAGPEYLELVDTLALSVPVTSTNRNWPNHVPLAGPHGLPRAGFAMTEQPRAISRSRLERRAGTVDEACLIEIRRWIHDFLGS
ncbi:type II toxin-antitoxin system PemK/MazF family toxin [Brachybacterium muris]|uniref:type II toxin-antitoxin system PemK/MazF family toxin n=1 Tax=Brachybacterium muris TaxID=219301 RepID=UPI00223AE476|nr:type II toxin-antitoxin system PemK/MazF family toxin [Brachybacterium muris]MCT1653993.1 type II toxin-antitoxin system PemK/MazF family toxin [Brachybacterium muris]MCT1999160.1 type II toxin-antitoxin system PemK/MazF family toxin [Brachybacterium muris]MCT2178554.1 type II toxin-antitoxin system PemK/MazF family toxin [Brachybacterium muris]